MYGGDDIHEQGQQARTLLSSNEQEIRFRDGQITQVARSVQEIATLMQDLSELVIDQVCSCAAFLLQFGRYEHILSQGTKFDRIDYNIEQTVHDTAQAVKQLAKVRTVLRTHCRLWLRILPAGGTKPEKGEAHELYSLPAGNVRSDDCGNTTQGDRVNSTATSKQYYQAVLAQD